MKEKETIKISLGTVICIIIIFILVLALIGMYINYNYDIIEKNEVTNIIKQHGVSSENTENNIENGEISTESLYKKYENEKLYWQIKDENSDKTNLEFMKQEIKVENGTAYIYTNNSNKKEISSIKGEVKYVLSWGEQTLERVYILTEEGTIWKSIYENEFKDDFTKVNVNGKVIDMTGGNSSLRKIEPPYFLLANGELVNEEGRSYKALDGNFVKSFGNALDQIFVKSDNTVYLYNYETKEYIQIKTENGTKLKMKDAFIQWSTENNNLVEETGGEDRIFVIANDDTLYYLDGYSTPIAKEYEKTDGKIVKDIVEEKEKLEYGEATNIKITFEDKTEIILKDANRNFFEN